MGLEVVIGLEIHVELLTESKMFCACSAQTFGAEPNTLVCPVCLGLPGSLPVANKKAVEYTLKTGLALNSKVAQFSQFYRKNYFYPDMVKNYQISQYDYPLCQGGFLEIEADHQIRKVSIVRVHLEEDTGKLIHKSLGGRIAEADYSLVDFNRSGVPLMEIVTQPDLRSPFEAKIFLTKLKNLLEYLGVSDCNMEQGSLRCDANVSVRPQETLRQARPEQSRRAQGKKRELGVKTEVKNMNSFKSLEKALSYEVERQKEILERGGQIEQETRHFDEVKGVTTSLRTKEYAHDYRYFPEPDLAPLEIDEGWVEETKKTLPELPEARKKRFQEKYNLSSEQATLLTSSKATADFFEECLKEHPQALNRSGSGQAQKVSNWILGEFSYHLRSTGLEIDEAAVTPKHLVQLLKLIDQGKISGKMAKEVFKESFETGKLPQIIVEEKSLTQIVDEKGLEKIIELVLEENPKAVSDYKAGKTQVLGFLVGQVMKLTRGRANPALVNKLLTQKLVPNA